MVSYNQSAWLLPVRPSTSCTPVARFAIHRDIWSEMKAPPIPQKRQNTASAWMFSPSGPMPLPTPRKRSDDAERQDDRDVGER